LKPLKYRLHSGARIFKNSYVPFFPYQVNHNAKRDFFHSSNRRFPLERKAPNCTVDGGHSSAKSQPGFDVHPQRGCPAAGKEQVAVSLFMVLTENTANININEM
jgi:hypothetical protein